jgi:uncharacterized protein (TIGR02265 family)
MIDTTGFVDPDWDAPLDVQQYVDACEPGQTLKGVFMQSVVDRAARDGKKLERARRYLAFKDYLCSDYNLLAEECAGAVYPDVSLRTAIRRFGNEAYPVFRSTVVGRVIAAAAGDDVESLIGSADKIYRVAISHGRAEVVVESGRALVTLRRIPTFADAFHVGAFEGVLRVANRTGRIRVRRHSLVDVDLLAEW